ncbi:F-box/WD repeat-containing protein 5-like [Gigantopelta aegis]|uniref:F-box/WD repeat-containing protein 5-like n=1 Tax=Gigantopelta aegis TaxID=1735272 RepID=UPI001B888594|nr:F-box/WD repeat-containing protein 5-like [Gigantopelta aegis]XP_041371173.1 F-box/WD repeat-containing protein 5-like [Gigantopelta aegis]XP_041371181.1 F-box/WD repeat-containing protein 5-like [Gigantopelta aegis]
MNQMCDPQIHKIACVNQECESGVNQVCDPGVNQVCDPDVSQVCDPQIHMCSLPDSLLLEIFSFLEAHDITLAAQVCCRWQTVSYDESLWRQLIYRRWSLKEKPARHPFQWRSEYQRLCDNVPNVLSETLTDHTDEVLHVSFSHDGRLFSTTSKDCTIKVWEVGFPTTLKYSQDFRSQFHWDFTQFSCFNATDTMLLVSSVKTAELDRRGYVAILSLIHDFRLLQVLSMDPSQLFGTWLNPTTFLGGSLEISLDRFITTVQIKAFKIENTPFSLDNAVAMATQSGETLFTFCSENASLIKFLTVVNNPCVSHSHTGHEAFSSGDSADVNPSSTSQSHRGHKATSSGDTVNVYPSFSSHSHTGHKTSSGDIANGNPPNTSDSHTTHQRTSGSTAITNSSGASGSNTGCHWTVCDVADVNLSITNNSNTGDKMFLSDSAVLNSSGSNTSHTGYHSILSDTVKVNSSRASNSHEEQQNTCSGTSGVNALCTSRTRTEFEATSSGLHREHQTVSNNAKPLPDNSCLDNSICFSDHCRPGEPTCSRSNLPRKTGVRVDTGNVKVYREESTACSKLCLCCRRVKTNHMIGQSSDCDITDLEVDGDETLPLSRECDWLDLSSRRSGDLDMTGSNKDRLLLSSECNDVLDGTCRDDEPDCFKDRTTQFRNYDIADSVLTSGCDVLDTSQADPEIDHFGDRTRLSENYNMVDTVLTSGYDEDEQQQFRDGSGERDITDSGEERPVEDSCDTADVWSSGQQGHCLIYVTGEFAVALHQLGFKALSTENKSSSMTNQESSAPQFDPETTESHMVVNYSNQLIEMQQVRKPDPFDHLIDLNGHITGLCLSRDHRYLFVNCRPWVGTVDRSDPWATPELSTEIEVRVIDLSTMEISSALYTGHKGLSPSTMCCFIFLDTSHNFVGSGSEDCKAYVWERRYGCLVGELPHGPGVVNAVAFCPSNQEYLVTVSDDNTIRIWRSRHDMRLLS